MPEPLPFDRETAHLDLADALVQSDPHFTLPGPRVHEIADNLLPVLETREAAAYWRGVAAVLVLAGIGPDTLRRLATALDQLHAAGTAAQ